MLCRACEELVEPSNGSGGFIAIEAVKRQVDLFNKGESVSEKELLDMCDTEGNDNNGGGSFDVRQDGPNKMYIRHVSSGGPGSQPFLHPAIGAPGEIGSPKPDRGAGLFGSHRESR
jgi:hypothetical protein